MTVARAPVTAIIASHNEARLLDRRLRELSFCDEVIVIDIDSDDDTAAVAAAHGRRVVRHSYVPIAEHARVDVAADAHHDWLLLNDPDEEIPHGLAAEAARFLDDPPPDLAVVFAPIVYLFHGRPLHGTIWGGTRARPFLVRRSGVELSAAVHRTLALKDGYRTMHFESREDIVIRHHWTSGYRDWLEKHRRYLALEGATRADHGSITGYRGIVRAGLRAFHQSFVEQRGYREGIRGLALSVLWGAYEAAADIALFRELRRRARLQ